MIDHVAQSVIPAAFALLPENMRSQPAAAMLLAIGLQESRFLHRRQIRGPARGFWQFELGGGVTGVLTHPATAPYAARTLTVLRYADASPEAVHAALEHNDVLAAVFARLLLWATPRALPNATAPGIGWETYLAGWRPGTPHRETWNSLFDEAWTRVALQEGDVLRA